MEHGVVADEDNVGIANTESRDNRRVTRHVPQLPLGPCTITASGSQATCRRTLTPHPQYIHLHAPHVAFIGPAKSGTTEIGI